MVASEAADMTESIYHERQVKELCALHALNNLFQERGFSKQELDQICYSLSPDVWINPHKSFLGFGNYDINVIMAALQKRGREAVWFDKRRDPKCLCLDNIEGFILNVPTEYKFGFVLLPLKRRHWIALKKIHGAFYNLDSKLDSPQLIGQVDEVYFTKYSRTNLFANVCPISRDEPKNKHKLLNFVQENDLLVYLKDQIDSKEKELFLVVSREIDSNQGWLMNACTEKEDNKEDRDSIRYIEDGYPTIDLKRPDSKEINENEEFIGNTDSR